MLKGNCRKKNLTICERKISLYKPALSKFTVENVQVFLLHNHLYFAPKLKKTSQYSIKTDFLEGSHVLQN